jgi:drug/metabolite transporter (DMT)-like permease
MASGKTKKIVLGTVVFILAEAVTFYAYSILFMLEGEPRRHNDPTLKALAWVFLAGMALEFVAFLCWFRRISK